MVTIKYVSRELTKVEQYRMTLDNAIKSCKDIQDGTEIEVDAFCEFEDTKASVLGDFIAKKLGMDDGDDEGMYLEYKKGEVIHGLAEYGFEVD